jgi:hypothetical protein
MDPVPFRYKWAQVTDCLICGRPSLKGRYRRFCSAACDALWRFHDGCVPESVSCVGCGRILSLSDRGKGGQRRKATTKYCPRCRNEYDKYKMTAAQLAERDGSACALCGEPVDMTLRRFDPNGEMCASVDHVTPRSLGGSHEPENLQLAHMLCNQRKSNRTGVAS